MSNASRLRDVEPPVAIDHLAARDVRPGLAAVAAGVHRERAADGARNAGEELGAVERRALAAKRASFGRGDAGFGDDGHVSARSPTTAHRLQRRDA